MRKTHTTLLGKSVRHISRLRGGGSALPGLVVEKLDKDFLSHTLSQLPLGVVVISGTNGKTTTTKMVTELLKSQGLSVFTNPTGSNFKRGVISALLDKVDRQGKLDADIAVLELDEAHAVHFVREVPPTYSLLINVMRDQLDRFGEIDTTTKMLQLIANATKKGVVLNREDPQTLGIGKKLSNIDTNYFGLEPELRHLFPSDDELRGEVKKPTINIGADVTVKAFSSGEATFLLGKKAVSTKLNITGIYNVLNAAAALSLVREIMESKIDETKLIETLSNVKPAFGRGEKMIVNGQELELVLVKNPSGFRLGLKSFSATDAATMIAINDNYADGRDMSWLWDVEFDSLRETGVRMVSGMRAYDMALRLQYDKVKYDFVDTDLKKALDTFINETGRPKRIFCSYTAMLTLRKELQNYAELERVL
ncbi:MAG: MurT ligase domain-containing protein [Candidatus Saccharibacteria bacterium]|nr:MurT ligase domain-containing protein [Candidatus Saccharibacteria bacterium]